MLESKIWEEAEQKSKIFLRQVMGNETFDEFIKNGKIQIKSGDDTYELYENGNVINVTNNQKYCIVPDRSDYPSYDVIAIKFAWLKYGQKTVERVANKTSLGKSLITPVSMILSDCVLKNPCSITARIIWQNLDSVKRIFRPRITIDRVTTVEHTTDVVIPAGSTAEIVMNISSSLLSGCHVICAESQL